MRSAIFRLQEFQLGKGKGEWPSRQAPTPADLHNSWKAGRKLAKKRELGTIITRNSVNATRSPARAYENHVCVAKLSFTSYSEDCFFGDPAALLCYHLIPVRGLRKCRKYAALLFAEDINLGSSFSEEAE